MKTNQTMYATVRAVYWAALSMPFILLILLHLAMFTLPAKAQEIACEGRNLMEGLEQSNPDLFARIQSDAQKIENGDNNFWKVSREGITPSYLFGTIHLTDPRVIELPAAAEKAFVNARVTVIETTAVLNKEKAAMELMANFNLTILPGTKTLDDFLEADELEKLKAWLNERSIPYATVKRMAPWMLTTSLFLPACEFERQKTGASILDVHLAERSEAKGSPVLGLEKLSDQLNAIAAIPHSFFLDSLIGAIESDVELTDVFETMVVLYEEQKIGTIMPMMEHILPEGSGTEEDSAHFEQVLINKRNRTMVENAHPILEDGNAFIAVGALHLPGEQGLVTLLRKEGYTVTPVE